MAEIQIYRGFDEPDGYITHEGLTIPFRYKDRFIPKGCRYRIYDLDVQAEMGACMFVLESGAATRVIRVITEDYSAIGSVLYGSGHALVCSPQGEVSRIRLDRNGSSSGSYRIEKGSVLCMIADKSEDPSIATGLSVFEYSSRPFNIGDETTPCDEEIVPVGDPSLPDEFWHKYHTCIGDKSVAWR